MVLLIIISKPLFIVLFTDKWNEAIPYFRILCLPGMLLSLHITNLNILKATGRSDLYFFLEIPKKIIGIVSIIIGIQFGIIGMLYGIVATSYLGLGINAFFSKRVVNYGIREQLIDVLPAYSLSIFVGIVTYFSISYFSINSLFISIITMISLYSILYIGISKLFHFEAVELFLTIVNDKISMKK